MTCADPVIPGAPRHEVTARPGAVEDARRAQLRWSSLPMRDRLRVVRRARERLAAGPRELAARVSGGVPLSRILVEEVLPLAEACRFLEREAERILAPRRPRRRGRPLWLRGVDLEVRREPHGVVLILGASNYPLFLPGVQALQALVSGNAVLLKPGRGALDAARAFRLLLVGAGLEPELFQVLPESPESGKQAIAAGADKVFLTGSLETGRQVLGELAPRVVPATLELSGSDAVFVRPEADVDLVVRALRFGTALRSGATCIAPRRVFVARELSPVVEKRLAESFSELPPFSVPADAVRPLRALVREALSGGARRISGGSWNPERFRAVLLAGARPDMKLLQTDVFAPVLSLVEVAGDEDALAANAACPYALGATVFGEEASARALARRIPAGLVVVNDVIVPSADPRVPFGGRGSSGFGVTRGPEGLLEMTVVKAIAVRSAGRRFHLEDERAGDEEVFASYIALAHGRGLFRRLRSLGRLVAKGMRRGREEKT